MTLPPLPPAVPQHCCCAAVAPPPLLSDVPLHLLPSACLPSHLHVADATCMNLGCRMSMSYEDLCIHPYRWCNTLRRWSWVHCLLTFDRRMLTLALEAMPAAQMMSRCVATAQTAGAGAASLIHSQGDY